MTLRRVIVVAVMLCAALGAATSAHAQRDAFSRGIHELAEAAIRNDDDAERAATSRLRTALTEWDRQIAALEALAGREATGAGIDQAELRARLGAAYLARGRFDSALRELHAAEAVRPSAEVLFVRALALARQGQSADAGRAFVEAWHLEPGNPVLTYYVTQHTTDLGGDDRDHARSVLADAYRQLSTPQARSTPPFPTVDALADGLSPQPVVGDARTGPAFALLAAGRYDEGVAALSANDGRGSSEANSPRLHLERGQRAETQNDVATARREYEAALTGTLVGRHAIYVALARLAQVDGDVPAAIDAFRRAVQLAPDNRDIRLELATVYAAESRFDDAFAELVAGVLVDPRDARQHAAIGQVLIGAGRPREAITAFQRALDLEPTRYEARYGLATALARAGSAADAARELERFNREREDALERRRRGIALEVQREEAARGGAGK